MVDLRTLPLPICLALACSPGGAAQDFQTPERLAATTPPDEPPASSPPRRNPEYPETPRIEVVDEVHGVKIVDPYRWLEDGNDAAVQKWLAAQNAYGRAKLAALPGRDWLTKRFTELYYIDQRG